jgi:hypothetical protein
MIKPTPGFTPTSLKVYNKEITSGEYVDIGVTFNNADIELLMLASKKTIFLSEITLNFDPEVDKDALLEIGGMYANIYAPEGGSTRTVNFTVIGQILSN